MQIYAEKIVNSIYDLKRIEEIELYYAEDKRFEVAMFDSKKKQVFSTFDAKVNFKKSFYQSGEYLYYTDKIELDNLNIKYLVIRGHSIEAELEGVKTHLYVIMTASFVFIIVLAYFLSKMFLRPIRNYISKLDDFIKDTTHELNTPLAAITMSIETIDKSALDPKTLRKIVRIDNAAKTISSLYQDLSFMALYGKNPNKDTIIELDKTVAERIEYFEPLADVKNIKFETTLEGSKIFIDKNKLRILIDNLISNAIKYNKNSGKIRITTKATELIIEDEGKGIPKEKIKDIFARYSRFDDASGGFGIGLSIVKMICDEYKIHLSVESELGRGTKFELKWNLT
jgi:two-component system OmpR family sensor kinase